MATKKSSKKGAKKSSAKKSASKKSSAKKSGQKRKTGALSTVKKAVGGALSDAGEVLTAAVKDVLPSRKGRKKGK
jgi:hypothetical protein